MQVPILTAKFAVYYISRQVGETACKICEWYFYTLAKHKYIVPPWKSVMEIQPFEVLDDGKGNVVITVLYPRGNL